MKNLWKLFAVSAFALVPVTANAAATVEVDASGVCSKAASDTTSTNMEVLTACNVKKVGDKEVKSISIAGALDIDKDITLSVPLNVTGALTVKAADNNSRRTVNTKEVTATGITLEYNTALNAGGAVDVTTNDINVKALASLSVTASNDEGIALTAINAANVILTSGTSLTVSANNKNTNVKDSENTAVAVAGDISVTGTKTSKSSVTVNNGVVNGDITATYTTVKVKDMTGDADLTNSTLTADKVDGGVDANASGATVKEITGAATAEGENAYVNAPKIGGAVTVDGEGAWAQFATAGQTVTVTKGMAKQKLTDADGKPYTLVKVADMKTVNGLASNERIELNTLADAKIVFTNAAKGATIINKTASDLIVSINGKDVNIAAYDAADTDKKYEFVVAEGTETPVDPTEPTDPVKPTDPDNVPDVPKTGDTVLVSSALGLVSLIGLAATVKSRKFN